MLRRWLSRLLRRGVCVKTARAEFHTQRESLQEAFFEQAAASGLPRGLRWKNCEWGERVEFLRERASGQLLALVEVVIHFEAIPDSDMDGWPAVELPRAASAVFVHVGGVWQTTGKTLFNLPPDEALERLAGQYDRGE